MRLSLSRSLTFYTDNSLSGVNLRGTTLNPANVNQRSSDTLFSQPVDGYVYAQPLYKANVTAGGEHRR